MKAPLRFYKSGLPHSHINDPTTGGQDSQNPGDTAGLLNWISQITIKRRQIRKSTRCSNLLAEATLSSALRKAKKDLAHKQEEKRNKLRLFCLSRSKKVVVSDPSSGDSDFELVKNPFSQKSNNNHNTNIVKNQSIAAAAANSSNNNTSSSYQLSYVLKDLSSSNNSKDDSQQKDKYNKDRETGMMMTDSEADDEVKACLSSLESFFKELKSVKVKV